MNNIKKILYYYDNHSSIVYRRRILPLKNQLKDVLLEEFNPNDLSLADVFILLSLPTDEKLIQDILNKKYSKWVVYDRTDDLGSIIDPNLSRKIIWEVLSVIKNKPHRSFIHRYFIQKSDLIVCGSKAQTNSVKKVNNYCSHIVDCITESEYPLLSGEDSKKSNEIPVVVWEGTHSSMYQLKIILKPLIQLQSKHRFKLIILSNIYNNRDKNFVNSLIRAGLNFNFVEWTLDSFKQNLLNADIAIAPIDVTKKFNRAKPSNKIITYWAYKLPVVASNIESYTEIIEQGKDGFICRNEKEWLENLSMLINDMDLTSKIGEKGFEKTINYTEKKFAEKYLDILYENLTKK